MPTNSEKTPEEAARWLRARGYACEVRTLTNWRSLGRGPRFCKVGCKVFYPLAELEAFAAKRTETYRSAREAREKANTPAPVRKWVSRRKLTPPAAEARP